MKWYVLLMAVLLTLFVLVQYNRPKVIDWSETLSKDDKIPYGCLLLFNEMSNYFGGVTPTSSHITAYEHIRDSYRSNEVYFLVAATLDLNSADITALKNYVEGGNTVFIGAERLSKPLQDSFQLHTYYFGNFFHGTDSGSVNLSNPALHARKDYTLRKNTLESYFSRFDTASTTVLGVNHAGAPNFIRLKLGKGFIYLHAAPEVFSNFFLLKDDNIAYIDRVLSYLPEHPTAVIWDEYYKSGKREPGTPLRVILSRADLRWAFYLSLLGIALFVLVQAKRKQRIIPVVAPPKNDSKIFVETVSRVYLNQKNHRLIAEKKIGYWLEHLRSHFQLNTEALNDEFAQALAKKTGIPEVDATELVQQVTLVRTASSISDNELLQINRLIDQFYKNTM